MKKSILLTVLLLASTTVFGQAKEEYTPQELFFMDYSRKQEDSQQRLVLMNKKGNMSKLGEEEINGLISGTLHYKTSLQGVKAVITLTYSNYSDEEGWLFDGVVITKANASANGVLDGQMEVDGVGTVYYDKVLLKNGKAGGGTYGVDLKEYGFQDVDYQLFFVACPEKK